MNNLVAIAARLFRQETAPEPPPPRVPELQSAIAQALADCTDDRRAVHLLVRVRFTQCPNELRLLRCEAHQCIARRFGEREANRRMQAH